MGKLKLVVFILILTVLDAHLAPKVTAAAVEAPQPRSRSEVEAVLAQAPQSPRIRNLRRLNIVLVADKKDHGVNEHDYPLWQKRWKLLLAGAKKSGEISDKQVNLYGPAPKADPKETLAGARKVRVWSATGWPSKKQLNTADLIVIFCYAKWDEQKLNDLEKFLARGGGFVPIHPAVITGKELSQRLASLIGLAWENGYTRWRHGPMDLKIAAPGHPICLGLPKTIHLLDEAYWPLKGDRSKVQILATSDETISKGSSETRAEPMFYAYQWGKGRVFSCILGHYTWTFDDPYFRILMLRGMAWAAGQSPYRFDSLVLRGIQLR